MLGKTTQRQGAVAVKLGVQASELVGLLVVVGAQVYAQFNRIYSLSSVMPSASSLDNVNNCNT